MLILERRLNQRIRVGEDIFITVTLTKEGRCKLGFDAPREVEIVRCELDERGTGDAVEHATGKQ